MSGDTRYIVHLRIELERESGRERSWQPVADHLVDAIREINVLPVGKSARVRMIDVSLDTAEEL